MRSRLHVDGRWNPADPVGWQPGWDIEMLIGNRWILYRTTTSESVEVHRGHGWMRLSVMYWWERLRRPIRNHEHTRRP